MPTHRFEIDRSEAILVVPEVGAFVKELWEIQVDAEDNHGEVEINATTQTKWDFIPLEHVDISNDNAIEICRGNQFKDIVITEYYDDMDVT